MAKRKKGDKVKIKQAKYLEKIKENRRITDTQNEIRNYKTEKER